MNGDKSYVGMNNCYFCGEPSEILIDRRMRNTLSRDMGVMNMNPCSKCKEYMQQGILLMSISDDTVDEDMQPPIPNPYKTGGWCIVKDEAVQRMVSESMFKFASRRRFIFITDEAWDKVGLPRK